MVCWVNVSESFNAGLLGLSQISGCCVVLQNVTKYVCRLKILPPPLRFSEIFSQQLRIFKQNFACLLCIDICAKLQNFIQLSLNLTKLCHIKCNHPVNFYLSQPILHELLLFDDKQWVKIHFLLQFLKQQTKFSQNISV